jgi:flagellar biosynthetic protein FliP
MVPPSTIALPLKVLVFVLVDGWALVLRGVLGSFK